ncbi:MAG: 23S rRNA (pseudouridine(1915)-N(3))-methyltransferase RlmH [Candidatus Baltobacteraceae bacterium]
MHVRLLAVGKLREPYAAQACAQFAKRLARHYAFEVLEARVGKGRDPQAVMREEAARLLAAIQPDDRVWLLDRGGTQFSSEELARELTGLADSGVRRLCLVIAGTYGAAEPLRERADTIWSLSQLTFLHEWARMIVMEQLYRAAKIVRNEPYHH